MHNHHYQHQQRRPRPNRSMNVREDDWSPGRGRGGRGRGGRGRGRDRGRVHRGDVRTAILHLLGEEGMHGYQIMQEIHERSDNAWQPSPGSIYPTLQLLADEGLVISESVGGKNVFSLTATGREAAEALGETPPWERLSDDQSAGVRALGPAMKQLAVAMQTVARTGSEQQIQRAVELIDDARKGIYGLLASDTE